MKDRRFIASTSRFLRQKRGSVAVMTALASMAILGSAALAIDVGSFFYFKRKQQTATDIAALVAANNLPSAELAARNSLSQNGIDPSSLQSVEYGAYAADASLSPSQRFQPSTAAAANAVRVTVKSSAPMIFGSALFSVASAKPVTPAGSAGSGSGGSSVPVRTQAVAAQANFASFAIGSRLASLDGGLLNSVLGKLLGCNLSLSVMDYQSLASANIDLFTFSKALATRAGLSAVTFGQLAASSVRVGDVLGALADAAQASGLQAGTAALKQIAAATAISYNQLPLSALVAFGPFSGLPATSQAPIAASLSALDILMAAAQIAGKDKQIALSLGATLPGLLSVDLQLAIGERPVGTSFVVIGGTGARISTAQTRLIVTVSLTGAAPLATVKLPIYLELASANATLTGLACGPGINTPSVALSVKPSVIDGWIGKVSDSDLIDFNNPPPAQPALLVDLLGLASVTGQAHATIANMNATEVDFTSADIVAGTKKTTSTTDFLTPLIQSLVGNLQLSVNAGNLITISPTILTRSLAQTLTQATPQIDQVLAQLLATLGLGVGEADTWVTGVRCGGGVLVN